MCSICIIELCISLESNAARARRRRTHVKGLAEEIGIPYQTLINLYLRDCAAASKRPVFEWNPGD
jgi:hypothetical protein